MQRSNFVTRPPFTPSCSNCCPLDSPFTNFQILYESIYDFPFDNRNFSRKVLSTELLIKQKEKDKANSKKGAFYYRLDKRKYKANFQAFLNFIPNPDKLLL